MPQQKHTQLYEMLKERRLHKSLFDRVGSCVGRQEEVISPKKYCVLFLGGGFYCSESQGMGEGEQGRRFTNLTNRLGFHYSSPVTFPMKSLTRCFMINTVIDAYRGANGLSLSHN